MLADSLWFYIDFNSHVLYYHIHVDFCHLSQHVAVLSLLFTNRIQCAIQVIKPLICLYIFVHKHEEILPKFQPSMPFLINFGCRNDDVYIEKLYYIVVMFIIAIKEDMAAFRDN